MVACSSLSHWHFTRVAAPSDQAGKLVGAEDGDGQRLQLAGDAVVALQGLAERFDGRVGVHGGGWLGLANTLLNTPISFTLYESPLLLAAY
jgi:hypothetical protein